MPKDSFRGEIELNFSLQHQFESLDGIESPSRQPIIARNVIRFLMMGFTEQWTYFLTTEVLQAVFVKRDREILKELRVAFQQGFLEIFAQIKNKDLNIRQQEQVQLYLSNCLSYIPYGDLTPYESIKIPQFIEGAWELVEYQVKAIELTESSGLNHLFIQDTDRVFAYGLEPIFQDKAESHLIFMGTTYPAGQGFLSQIKTDSKGFQTVGESLYQRSRNRIFDWLENQKNKIHVCGVSLGGSLSLLLAIDKGNFKLSRIDALNPAGLHEAYFKSKNDYWDELVDKPQVVVQKQGNDPVSSFGIWKEDWDIIKVIPPQDKQGPNPFFDHFLNYAGLLNTDFIYIDAKNDNQNRKARNILLYSLGRSLIYSFFIIPYTYVIRPMVHYWMISIPVVGIFTAASFTFAGALSGLALLSIAGVLITSFTAISLCFINTKIKKKPCAQGALEENEKLAQLHDPCLPRNPQMDIYNETNRVEINLTYQQIHTYYEVMRRLVKGKNYLPDHQKESKHVNGVLKSALLKESEDPLKAHLALGFSVTPAKAAHIRQSLYFVEKLGIGNDNLKQKLKKSYREYCIGKHM